MAYCSGSKQQCASVDNNLVNTVNLGWPILAKVQILKYSWDLNTRHSKSGRIKKGLVQNSNFEFMVNTYHVEERCSELRCIWQYSGNLEYIGL